MANYEWFFFSSPDAHINRRVGAFKDSFDDHLVLGFKLCRVHILAPLQELSQQVHLPLGIYLLDSQLHNAKHAQHLLGDYLWSSPFDQDQVRVEGDPQTAVPQRPLLEEPYNTSGSAGGEKSLVKGGQEGVQQFNVGKELFRVVSHRSRFARDTDKDLMDELVFILKEVGQFRGLIFDGTVTQ